MVTENTGNLERASAFIVSRDGRVAVSGPASENFTFNVTAGRFGLREGFGRWASRGYAGLTRQKGVWVRGRAFRRFAEKAKFRM